MASGVASRRSEKSRRSQYIPISSNTTKTTTVSAVISVCEIGVAAGYRHVYTSGNSDGYFATIYLGLPIQ